MSKTDPASRSACTVPRMARYLVLLPADPGLIDVAARFEEDEPAAGAAVGGYPRQIPESFVEEDGASSLWPSGRPPLVPPQGLPHPSPGAGKEPAFGCVAAADAGCGFRDHGLLRGNSVTIHRANRTRAPRARDQRRRPSRLSTHGSDAGGAGSRRRSHHRTGPSSRAGGAGGAAGQDRHLQRMMARRPNSRRRPPRNRASGSGRGSAATPRA